MNDQIMQETNETKRPTTETPDGSREVRFDDVVVNRKALVQALRSLYDVDETTVRRLEEEDSYFIDVAERLLSESKAAMGSALQKLFLGAYGIENGTPKTLFELATELGTTRETVRQVLARETRKLKHPTRRQNVLRSAPDEDV